MRRRRLDTELVRRGLVASRAQAQAAVAAGRVILDGAPTWKPSTQVLPSQALALTGPARPFVSRGGEKLAGALDRFGLDPTGRVCLDVGASTGGFTDCLLQRGAASVVAVDVGYGQLHDALRRDPRVTVLERTNARALEAVPGPAPDLVVADLSFISLTLVLPALRRVTAAHAEAVLLVKPQFEAGRGEVGSGGVVREPAVRARTVLEVAGAARTVGWDPAGVVASSLAGPAGNVEFLVHLATAGRGLDAGEFEARVEQAVAEAEGASGP
ncbi:MAG TPA: TlyA family RNA methyltransferase [Nitriliruptorales bacterium]|nr:TlyA family RNA methyltransferase [Nitriliruptorales bacterium]